MPIPKSSPPPRKTNEISNLQSQIRNLQSQISDPESEISALKSEISNLRSEISNLQSPHPLPKGWRWGRLGEVCEQDRTIIEAGSPQAGRLPYLGLEHVEAQTGRILRKAGRSGDGDGKSTTFAFSVKHVLYGKLRPYLNKVALPNYAGRCTTELIPLLPGKFITREFLAWVLRRPETVHAAMQDKTGSRMPRAGMRELMSLEVPLPPLAEQKRIAAILKEQLAAVDKARAAAEARLEAVNALPAALLRRAFNGEL